MTAGQEHGYENVVRALEDIGRSVPLRVSVCSRCQTVLHSQPMWQYYPAYVSLPISLCEPCFVRTVWADGILSPQSTSLGG